MQLPVEIGARGNEVVGCVGREWGVVAQLFEREGTNDGRVTASRTDVLAQMRPAGAAKGGASSEKTTTFPKKVWTFRSISACFDEKLSVFETLKAYKRRKSALKRVEDAIFRSFDLTELKNSANFALRQFVVFRFNVTKKLHFITI